MSNEKAIIILLIEIVSVTPNLSNYVTHKKMKNVTKVDTSDFALKTNVA